MVGHVGDGNFHSTIIYDPNKKEYLKKQHPDNLPLMKILKKGIDPKNIMNPGKVFDLN